MKLLIKELKGISDDLQCNGFFACPGITKYIYTMRTCRTCASVIRLNRIIKRFEKRRGHGRARVT